MVASERTASVVARLFDNHPKDRQWDGFFNINSTGYVKAKLMFYG